jgi:UrcA family protein
MNTSAPASAGVTVIPVRATLKGVLLAAALAPSLVGGAATAVETASSVTVRYSDLNLASDAGRRTLLTRLSAAAHRVCDDSGTRELWRVARADACFREALSNAVFAAHDERLTALYRAHTGAGAT